MMHILWPPVPTHKPIRTHLPIPPFRGLHLQHTQILPRAIQVSRGFVISTELPFLFPLYLLSFTFLALP